MLDMLRDVILPLCLLVAVIFGGMWIADHFSAVPAEASPPEIVGVSVIYVVGGIRIEVFVTTSSGEIFMAWRDAIKDEWHFEGRIGNILYGG